MSVNDVEDDRLDELARTAWKPVSEPPVEADGDADGDVLLLLGGSKGATDHAYWKDVATNKQMILEDGDMWARIKDVVLLPPAATEGGA